MLFVKEGGCGRQSGYGSCVNMFCSKVTFPSRVTSTLLVSVPVNSESRHSNDYTCKVLGYALHRNVISRIVECVRRALTYFIPAMNKHAHTLSPLSHSNRGRYTHRCRTPKT